MRERTKKNISTDKNTAISMENMAKILSSCGIVLDKEQVELLWSYHNLIRRHNPELNLTRIKNFTSMVIKLYADSIYPELLMDLPSPLIDLGTGAGMPGIPLKIAHPNLYIILAESRKKRVIFLNNAVSSLGLDNIEVHGGMITEAFDRPVSGVITRAVEPIEKTLERISGCLEKNGLAIFMKGPGCGEELIKAQRKQIRDYRLVDDISYEIPGTPNKRRLVVFERKTVPKGIAISTAMNNRITKKLTSSENNDFKRIKKLSSAKGIKKEGLCIVYGSRIVADTIKNHPDLCVAWISLENEPPPADLPGHVKWFILSKELFREVDIFNTRSPFLIVAPPQIKTFDQDSFECTGCVPVIPFQDPENVGAVIRTAAAFGVTNAILTKEAAHPYLPKAIRTSAGMVFDINFFWGPSIEKFTANQPIVALDRKGRPITSFSFPENFFLVPGIEGPGLPCSLNGSRVSIPMKGRAESLNAAVAASIALFAWNTQR